MKKSHKAIPTDFQPINMVEMGYLFAYVVYDVRKLRRMAEDKLSELIRDKTIDLYPFAIVQNEVEWCDKKHTTLKIPVYIYMHPNIKLREDNADVDR